MPITKQTIAIIGAGGNMGSAIARSIADGNYRLLLFDQDSEEPSKLAEGIREQVPNAEVKLMDCAHNCGWEADIIILAVPHGSEKEIAGRVQDVATQKIVISMANPANESFSQPTRDPDTSAAEELQQWLPHSRVVKAFNTIFAADFEQPIIDGKQVDAFIAGDDEDAIQAVTELVETAGFHPIIAGDLEVSRTLEGMQQLLMQLKPKNRYNGQAAWKVLHD